MTNCICGENNYIKINENYKKSKTMYIVQLCDDIPNYCEKCKKRLWLIVTLTS